jgi:Right handed beta helix region
MRTRATGRRSGRVLLFGVALAAAAAVLPSGVALAAEPAPPSSQAVPSSKASAADTADDQAADKNKESSVESEQQTREEAAAKQQAQDAVVEQQERAQAAAEARANKFAAAGQRARASWESHGRANRLIIIRQLSVDVISNGRLTRQVPRAGGALTLSALDRFVPNDWLTVKDESADLASAIVLTAGTTLTLGGDVQTVRLAGGRDDTDASSIYTGRGRLNLRGVTVSSYDEATGAPMPIGPGRPFLVVSGGGRFESTDATVQDLGTPTNEAGARAGIGLGLGSTGSLVRTTLARNSVGLKLDRSISVRLQDVTVRESESDGLVLRGDRGTTMAGVKAERNGGNGVLVTGPSVERPITGISASGNAAFGIALLGQTGSKIDAVDTASNTVGGVRVSWSTDILLRNVTTADDPIGVYTHVGSAGIVLERVHLIGARRGLQVEKTTRGLKISDSTIEKASITGVAIGGHEVTLDRLTVNDSTTGVRVERGAGDVTAQGLSLAGGDDGFVALTATTNIVLRNLTVDGASRTALRTFSPDLQLVNGRLTGSSTGIDAGAATIISATTIGGVDEGIRARSPDYIKVNNADVSAFTVGINAAPGSPITLTDSRVDALEAIRGNVQQAGANRLSLPPLNLLGAIGVPLILLALILEQVQALRQGGHRSATRRVPPAISTEPARAGA